MVSSLVFSDFGEPKGPAVPYNVHGPFLPIVKDSFVKEVILGPLFTNSTGLTDQVFQVFGKSVRIRKKIATGEAFLGKQDIIPLKHPIIVETNGSESKKIAKMLKEAPSKITEEAESNKMPNLDIVKKLWD